MVRQAQDRLPILKGRNWKEERVMGVEYATSRMQNKQINKQKPTKYFPYFSGVRNMRYNDTFNFGGDVLAF